MVLLPTETPDRNANGTQYILFFASGTPPWCSDCREALPAIEEVFGGDEAPTLQVVSVGYKEEWKSTHNRWRGEPFYVKDTPCIVKLVESKETKRLGEQACKSVGQLREVVASP